MLCIQEMQIKYTMGEALAEDQYHIGTVRSSITRNLAVRFDEIKDEIQESWMKYILPTDGESISIDCSLLLFLLSDASTFHYRLGFCSSI